MPEAIPDQMAEKVHDLIDGKRVLVQARFAQADVPLIGGYVYAYVIGDHEPYVVRADNDAVRCSCWAAQMRRDCAHRYAAMAVWAEQGYGADA